MRSLYYEGDQLKEDQMDGGM